MIEELIYNSTELRYRNNYYVYICSLFYTCHYIFYIIFFLIKTKLILIKMSNNISDLFNIEIKLFLYKD